MLNERGDKKSIYYPNAGMLLCFLTNRCGVVNINPLFNSSSADMNDHFWQSTGESWKDMSTRYEQYISDL